MTLQFDLGAIKLVEFGVGRDTDDGRIWHCVPINKAVQEALVEMANTTWENLSHKEAGPTPYEPSEKHASQEYLTLPLEDDLSSSIRELYEAENIPFDVGALKDPSSVFAYFSILKDDDDRRLVTIRRAMQFKGVLKNRLITLGTDTLRIIEDKVFKLDIDFDLLVDEYNIHILRPSAFEAVGQLQSAVLAAVPTNIASVKRDLTFVDFEGIQKYATIHPRAARYLASIRAQKETKNINKANLKKLCKRTGVSIKETKGKISVEDGHVMGFLEVLDRRRYEIELVSKKPEQYRAASRTKLGDI